MAEEAAAGGPGRRERKKSQTRQAIRLAAHRLFAERGFADTTIEDITDAVDVSRRTFFRYFASKEDLLRVDVADLMPVMLAQLAARPADEAPMRSVLIALTSLIGPDGPPELAASLAGPTTGVRARLSLLRILADWERGIADTLLARWGFTPATAPEALRLRSVVLACAATSALRSSAQVYRERHGRDGLDPGLFVPILEQAFAALTVEAGPG